MIAIGGSCRGNKTGSEPEWSESVGSQRSKAVHASLIGAEAVDLNHAAEQFQSESQIPLEELFKVLRIYRGHADGK